MYSTSSGGSVRARALNSFALPASPTLPASTTLGAEEGAQDVREDAAVADVLDVLGGVGAREGVELLRLAGFPHLTGFHHIRRGGGSAGRTGGRRRGGCTRRPRAYRCARAPRTPWPCH